MSKTRSEHAPVGNPCLLCNLPASQHRVDHEFMGGNPKKCENCGLPLEQHRLRGRNDNRKRNGRAQKKRASPRFYLGMDGEGQGRVRHRYVLLAASDEDGSHEFYVADYNGLSTEKCLGFIWSLPQRARIFTYSFGYDLTKILQDVDEKTLYTLFRPETRQRFGKEAIKGPRPVPWKGWLLNLQGTKFTISRRGKNGRKRIIWDIWKFYQSKFVTALEDWKVGTKEERELIQRMKDKRNEFDKESPEAVRGYCFLECRKMAGLAHKLVDAHEAAGLPLKSFYGAGSTAAVMLDAMNVRAHIRKPPEDMREAVAAAFAGGRFDNSVVGCIRDKVYGWDISSAYPYQCCQVPCLAHGRWEHTTRREDLERCKHALIRYGMRPVARDILERPWGPFPFRCDDGSITYPSMSGGGWVWQSEFYEGERLFPQVHFREAWVWRPECECMPFVKIPHHYLERCRIGKEGPGIVLKLGCNSCYGKVAQSVGNGRYNCWIWAGMITSGCRAQVLHALGLHRDWEKMLMVATDGILTLENIQLPAPIDTGTDFEFKDDKGRMVRKPLGGWERKDSERGVFIARPGVYFPNDPTPEEIKIIRGRGVGRGVVLENWKDIVRTWENWGGRGAWPELKLRNVDRFCGAKTSISKSKDPKTQEWIFKRAAGEHLDGEPAYGEWITREVKLSFDPLPKRGGIGWNKQSLLVRHPDDDTELRYRDMLRAESAPYSKATISEEAKQMMLIAQQIAEQPHGDFTEYGFDDHVWAGAA